MSALDLDIVRTIAYTVALAIGGAVGILWTIRSGFFTLQKRTVETLKETLSALEMRVDQLEQKVREYEQRNSELEGMVEGKDRAIAELIAQVAKSGLCGKAWECVHRVVPVEKPKRQHTASKPLD